MYNKINKYRDAIMGVVILQIMFHHSGLNVTSLPFLALKRYIGGPDIFLFVSGFGCAVSLMKNKDTVSFYLRRIKRIYPTYIPILIIFLIMAADDQRFDLWIRDFLGNITGFSHWAMIGIRFNWYLVAIPLFYTFTPPFFEIIQKYSYKGLVTILVLSFIAGWCFASAEVLISISRFPIYILGIAAGMKKFEGKKSRKIHIYLYGIVGCVILVLKFMKYIPDNNYNAYYPSILTTPAIIYCLYDILEVIRKYALGNKILQFLSFIGKISLEIYLIHITFFKKIGNKFMGGMTIQNLLLRQSIIRLYGS